MALEAISCERDDRLLISQLSLALELGQVLQVEGPNGCGKTTLLRVLTTLSGDYQGEIFWQGQKLKAVKAEYLSQLLYIGHTPGIKGSLSPLENLRWSLSISAAQASVNQDEQIFAALARVGLTAYAHVACHRLSAGQQRRVALAKMFLFTVPLWILDEPFTAIDKQGIAELENVIDQQVKQGGLVILTTHHDLKLQQSCRKLRLGGG